MKRFALSFNSCFAAPLILVLALSSCTTMLNQGMSGFEGPLLPPYQTDADKPLSLALGAKAGGGYNMALFFPFIAGFSQAAYAEAGAILQWQAAQGAGFCGSVSASAWLGGVYDSGLDYVNEETGEHIINQDWAAEPDPIFYGWTGAARIGYARSIGSKDYYTPSIAFRYSWEEGPYYQKRLALAQLVNEYGLVEFFNPKPLPYAWVFSVAPADFSLNGAWGRIRGSWEFGWSDLWLNMICVLNEERVVDESTPLEHVQSFGVLVLPTNQEIRLSYQLPKSGMYIGGSLVVNRVYFFSVVEGVNLGIGWVF